MGYRPGSSGVRSGSGGGRSYRRALLSNSYFRMSCPLNSVSANHAGAGIAGENAGLFRAHPRHRAVNGAIDRAGVALGHVAMRHIALRCGGPAMGLGQRHNHGQRDGGHCDEASGEHRRYSVSLRGRACANPVIMDCLPNGCFRLMSWNVSGVFRARSERRVLSGNCCQSARLAA